MIDSPCTTQSINGLQFQGGPGADLAATDNGGIKDQQDSQVEQLATLVGETTSPSQPTGK